MIKRGILLILILFLAGCTVEEVEKPATVVCNTPYIRHADDCCLDQNSNKICDQDEEAEIEIIEEPRGEVPLAQPEITTLNIEQCKLNSELNCINAIINDSGVELELKNNLTNEVRIGMIKLKGYCTEPFDIEIQAEETIKLFINCKIQEYVPRIYYSVLYDIQGVEVNKEKSGTLILSQD